MNDIPPIKATVGPGGMRPQPRADEGAGGELRPAPPASQTDRVDISEMGQLLSTLELNSDIRVDKVTEIREAIANGTYETEAKIDYTVSRLLEDLRATG